ncbi:hypothetical protein BSLA_01r3505 [Burkholderia stabilis]|nr:hypothetical protein BSLA_01r3505 [Burkholderia stabilis]
MATTASFRPFRTESSPHDAIDEANPVRSINDLANCSDKS